MEAELEEVRSDLAELPKGWAWRTMEEVSEVVGGATPKTSEQENYEGGTIAWLTPADLSGYSDKYIERGARFITKKGLESCSTKLLPKGTVLFTSRAPIGYVAIASGEVCTNQGFKSFVLDEAQVTPDYVYWWLKGAKAMAEEVASGTTFLELSTAKAKKLPIPVAPLPQQRRIVEAIELQLGRLDAAVARLQGAKARLKRYKQAVLKAAVEGRLTEEWREKNAKKLPSAEKVLADLKKARDEAFKKLQKVERADGERQVRKPKDIEPITEDELASLPELPEGWAYARVGNAVNDIFDGPFGSHLKSVDYIDAGVRVIRLENIVFLGFRDDLKSYVSQEKYNTIRNHTVGAGDIIFSSFINEQTRVAVLPDHIDLAINKSDCFCVRIDNVPMDRNYVHYFLSSDMAYSQLVHGIHGATRPRINTTQLKQCPIPVCSLEEQRVIARLVGNSLTAADETEATLDAQLQQAVRLRQAVLKRAFEGRLTP